MSFSCKGVLEHPPLDNSQTLTMWKLLQAIQANDVARLTSTKMAMSGCPQNYDTKLIILVTSWFKFSYTN